MKLLGGLLSETASLRLRIRIMRDAWRDGMSVAQSVRARTFCVDFTYFHIHCEFHCEVKCEMVQSFHCEITFPAGEPMRHGAKRAMPMCKHRCMLAASTQGWSSRNWREMSRFYVSHF